MVVTAMLETHSDVIMKRTIGFVDEVVVLRGASRR